MTRSASSTKNPISFSFQKYRDDDIVGFFANDNRTFEPDSCVKNLTKSAANTIAFGQSRIVGKPHFLNTKSPGTAEFRASGTISLDEKKTPKADSNAKRDDSKNSIDFISEIFSLNVAENTGSKKKLSQKTSLDATLPFCSVAKNVTQNAVADRTELHIVTEIEDAIDVITSDEKSNDILKLLRESDDKLGKLLDSWGTLSPRMKETIFALVDVDK